jgi:phosphatidylethanolamine-binding protein (PEBP) family uncharacterized protein
MRRIAVLSLSLCLVTLPATAFDLSFAWGPLKSCTNGRPNTVASPQFTLKDVPEGTQFIRFKMVDKNRPSVNHGGGTVAWAGGNTVPAGAFKYKSPCPPDGPHVYEWTATAQAKKSGGKLGEATARRQYPE